MLHNISPKITARMNYLERIDARDRRDGTPRSHRLRQIPPETGRFLALMAASSPEGDILEVGTSAGYSALWLALAGEHLGRTITTFELSDYKIALARETFLKAGVTHLVNLVEGSALEYLQAYRRIAFCFLDAEKEIYEACYELVVPRLVPGGLLIADNASSHKEELAPMIEKVLSDQRVDALVVPIGKGELVCRKIGPAWE